MIVSRFLGNSKMRHGPYVRFKGETWNTKNRWSDSRGIQFRLFQGEDQDVFGCICRRANVKGRQRCDAFVVRGVNSRRWILAQHRASANRVVDYRSASTRRRSLAGWRVIDGRRRRALGGVCPGSAVYR